MDNLPFHNPNAAPLPDANDIEREFQGAKLELHEHNEAFELNEAGRSQLAADKRWLRNLFIRLLLIGFAIGGVLAIGLVWGMHQLDMINPPNPFEVEGDRGPAQ